MRISQHRGILRLVSASLGEESQRRCSNSSLLAAEEVSVILCTPNDELQLAQPCAFTIDVHNLRPIRSRHPRIVPPQRIDALHNESPPRNLFPFSLTTSPFRLLLLLHRTISDHIGTVPEEQMLCIQAFHRT